MPAPSAPGTRAEAAVVDDQLVEADRQQVGGQVAHRPVEVWALQRGGQLDEPHHQTGVGEPDADLARQAVLFEHRAQLQRETVGVDDLTVDDEADRKWMDDCLAHTTTVGAAGWQRYDGVGTDVEGDGRCGPARSETDASAGRQIGNPHVPLIGLC